MTSMINGDWLHRERLATRFTFAAIYTLTTLLLVFATPVPSWADDPVVWPGGPTGNLLMNLPEIGERIDVSPPSAVTNVQMWLNASPVHATYDPTKCLVSYVPNVPLTPGPYNVKVTVEVTGWASPIASTWAFVVPQSVPDEIGDLTSEQLSVLHEVNRLRLNYSLPPMALNRNLTEAASYHATYLSRIGSITHEETPFTSGFVGESPIVRANASGYPGYVCEDIEQGNVRTLKQYVDDLFDAPYHRIALLTPGIPDIGVGCSINSASTTSLVMDFSGSGTEDIVVSPYDGQTGVPTAWLDTDQPDPMRMRTPQGVTGYPLEFCLFTFRNERFGLKSASLTDPNGNPVAVFVNTPDNDNQLMSAALIIPKEPLSPHTQYTATVTGVTQSGVAISRIWSFTTSATSTHVTNEAQTNEANQPSSNTVQISFTSQQNEKVMTVQYPEFAGQIKCTCDTRNGPELPSVPVVSEQNGQYIGTFTVPDQVKYVYITLTSPEGVATNRITVPQD